MLTRPPLNNLTPRTRREAGRNPFDWLERPPIDPEPRMFAINRWADRSPRWRYPLLLVVLLLLVGIGGTL